MVPEFKNYLFIEKNVQHFQELTRLANDYPDKSDRLNFVNDDANRYLEEWCISTDWRTTRAVIFLDPFGMEVSWSLLQTIVNTKSVDLWLLFSISGVNRHLTTDGHPPAQFSERLTRVLGTDDWLSEFYVENPQLGLFDEQPSHIKEVNYERLGAYFVRRLETIFAGVADNPLVLRNSRNTPLFLLCFATANPKQAPNGAAMKIARDILRKL